MKKIKNCIFTLLAGVFLCGTFALAGCSLPLGTSDSESDKTVENNGETEPAVQSEFVGEYKYKKATVFNKAASSTQEGKPGDTIDGVLITEEYLTVNLYSDSFAMITMLIEENTSSYTMLWNETAENVITLTPFNPFNEHNYYSFPFVEWIYQDGQLVYMEDTEEATIKIFLEKTENVPTVETYAFDSLTIWAKGYDEEKGEFIPYEKEERIVYNIGDTIERWNLTFSETTTYFKIYDCGVYFWSLNFSDYYSDSRYYQADDFVFINYGFITSDIEERYKEVLAKYEIPIPDENTLMYLDMSGDYYFLLKKTDNVIKVEPPAPEEEMESNSSNSSDSSNNSDVSDSSSDY